MPVKPPMRIINDDDHYVIRLRAPYRRWLILHYGNPAEDLVIEGGSRRSVHRLLNQFITMGKVRPPLYVIFARPKDYVVAFPGADR